MKGYLNNPEATAEYFTEDGYAAMGDLGYYDEEGRMFYKDRIKDVMRVKAKWFGPSELEEHVEKLDEVYEVCVWVRYFNLDLKNLKSTFFSFRVLMTLSFVMTLYTRLW